MESDQLIGIIDEMLQNQFFALHFCLQRQMRKVNLKAGYSRMEFLEKSEASLVVGIHPAAVFILNCVTDLSNIFT